MPHAASTVDAGFVHLRAGGVSVVLATDGPRLPRLLHWGADLGGLDGAELAALATAVEPPLHHSPTDVVHGISLVPEQEAGWIGRPGIQGSRDGRDWSPAMTGCVHQLRTLADGGQALTSTATDGVAHLQVRLEVELRGSGLLRTRATLTNTSDDEPYTLERLRVALPVPDQAAELLDFTGRHIAERTPQRTSFDIGVHSREVRTGRSGLDSPFLLVAGEPGFGFRHGEVWGLHLAWSGNQELYGERCHNSSRVLGAGELLLPHELVLAPGACYEAPWLVASYGVGLDEMSARFHAWVRALPSYASTPRPVVLNTWEAVYFDHDLERLRALAERAAAVGVERFVLDDGWFGDRRDDHRALGDWQVSRQVWPDGLDPLISTVRALGMQFGLWVEPEMVNLDSDLARSHPEWLMQTGGRVGYSCRNQHVLDLTHPDCYDHILGCLDALLVEYPIDYLKWDHNRTLVEAGHSPSGIPAAHGQTLAAYRLMDELHTRHPGLEIESCASGGGRVDLGILERTQRVWGSDCNDPLERRDMHRWTQLVVPPEVIGAHLGSSPSHTTGRQHDLAFRAETALWCHFGLELDLTRLSDDDLAATTQWVTAYKDRRKLLHTGTVVNCDIVEPSLTCHGVVAADRSRALFSVAYLGRSASWPLGRVRLPGLDPEARYRVTVVPLADGGPAQQADPAWMGQAPALSGRMLATTGLAVLAIRPEHSYLIQVDPA
ncbi:MAG: alpha-galactosidase [Cellulomonas sp.]|nr:alpha-galactosidase [Cellulomonas sp.]